MASADRVQCAPFSTDRPRGVLRVMLEVNPIRNTIKDLRGRTDVLRGYL